jgi:hypothetical protein
MSCDCDFTDTFAFGVAIRATFVVAVVLGFLWLCVAIEKRRRR